MNKGDTNRWVEALSRTHDADLMALFLDFIEERRRLAVARRTCKPIQLPGEGRVSIKGIL